MVDRSHETDLLAKLPTGLFIAGQWRPATDGRQFVVEDPATGEALVEVADAGPDDAEAAVDAAVDAQRSWAATTPRHRADILMRAWETVKQRTEEFALLIALEMGKPLAEARAEVAYGAEFLRWYAEEAPRAYGRYSTSPNGAGRILTVKQPVGPCLFITPWNFPLAMGTRKIGPALAAGCTVVVKPAAQTPLAMLLFARVLEDCGLPAGVCNVVTTTSAGATMEPIIRGGKLRKLSFTGSTAVGRTLLEQAAEKVLRVSMELGGNAPFLVFEDADLDAVVEGAFVAKMRNMGQSCIAANRFLVQQSVASDFAERFAERLSRMKVGRGTDADVEVGPMIDERARQGIHTLVEDARRKGARTLLGGELSPGPGYFYGPTVLCDVPDDADISREEIFGPVAPILTFEDENDAIRKANDTPYGLAAYLYTRDISRALRVTEGLEYGMVGVNRGLISNPAAPFGGVKHSGIGREGGPEGLEEYLETKYVSIDL